MKSLPWIFAILVVVAIVYYFYSKRTNTANSTSPLLPQTTSGELVKPTNTGMTADQTPQIISGSQFGNSSCVHTPPVVALIKNFKESGALQIPLRIHIRENMRVICPEGIRYLVR